MSSNIATNSIADILFRSIENHDYDTFELLFSKQAIIWHNFDNVEQSASETRSLLELTSSKLSHWKYQIAARYNTPYGFIQQHVLNGIIDGNQSICIPICVIVTISHGKIDRIDEYLDPTPLQQPHTP